MWGRLLGSERLSSSSVISLVADGAPVVADVLEVVACM